MNSYKSRRYRRMQGNLNYKNKILSILLISVMVFGMIPMQAYSTVDTSHSDNVEIKDENLAKALKDEIKKIEPNYNNESISKEKIKLLVDIDLSNKGIKNLAGIENAVNLENINLEGNEISNISFLGKLERLKSINMSNQNIVLDDIKITDEKINIDNTLINIFNEKVVNITGNNLELSNEKDIVINDIKESKEVKFSFKEENELGEFSGDVSLNVEKNKKNEVPMMISNDLPVLSGEDVVPDEFTGNFKAVGSYTEKSDGHKEVHQSEEIYTINRDKINFGKEEFGNGKSRQSIFVASNYYIDFKKGFTINNRVVTGNQPDGITVGFANKDNVNEFLEGGLSHFAGSLGVLNNYFSSMKKAGLKNALVCEIDTFKNPDDDNVGDEGISDKHISIVKNGEDGYNAERVGEYALLDDSDINNKTKRLKLQWKPSDQNGNGEIIFTYSNKTITAKLDMKSIVGNDLKGILFFSGAFNYDTSNDIYQRNGFEFYVDSVGTMPEDSFDKIDLYGKYRINSTGAANVFGCENNISTKYGKTSTPMKVPGIDYTIEKQASDGRVFGGGGNSSSNVLKSNSKSNRIYKAYLINEFQTNGKSQDIKAQAKLGMILRGPKGGEIKADGRYGSEVENPNGDVMVFPSSSRIVAATVTDVTEFVKEQGYGTYIGINNPYYPTNSTGRDQVGSWKLIVLEEDESLDVRKISLIIGAADISKEQNVKVEDPGIEFRNDDLLSGEVLISTVGGDPDRTGSYVKYVPNNTKKENTIDVQSDDRSTSIIDRPANGFLQGVIDTDGVLSQNISQISGISNDGRKFYNTDLALYNVSAKESSNHNIIMEKGSPGISLILKASPGTSGSVTGMGISASIGVASYEKDIKLYKGEKEINETNKVKFGDEFTIKASVKNTSSESPQLGSKDSTVSISVPENISLDRVDVVATYSNESNGKTGVRADYSIDGNKINIKFGEEKNSKGFVEQYGSRLDIVVNGLTYKETVKDGQELLYSLELKSGGIIDKNGVVRENLDGELIKAFSESIAMTATPDIMPDINLRKLINLRYLNKGEVETEPTVSELRGLSGEIKLNMDPNTLDDKKVKNIKGLEYITNVEMLWIAYNDIEDLTPLKGLTNLKKLYSNNNKISNLTPLAGLNLEHLELANNKLISNLAPLSGITSLKYLTLDGNRISDIEPLKNLNNLKTLILGYYSSGNLISDISHLRNLEKLEILYLDSNQIVDISSMTSLNQLKELYIRKNKVENINSLRDLSELIKLDLRENEISDVSSLGGLNKLTELNLDNNHIYDISHLSHLGKLYTVKNQTIDVEEQYINSGDFVVDNIVINAMGKREANVFPNDNGILSEDNTKITWEQGLLTEERNNLSYRWMDNNYKYSGTVNLKLEQVDSPDYMVCIPSSIKLGDIQDELSELYDPQLDEKSESYVPGKKGKNPIVTGQVGAKDFISIKSERNITGNIKIYTDAEFLMNAEGNTHDEAKVNSYKTFTEKISGNASDKNTGSLLMTLNNNNHKDVFRVKASTSEFKQEKTLYSGQMKFVIEFVN